MAKERKNKQSKIQEQYNREYKNLKARVRAQEKQGYFGYNIPVKVKKPTLASINKLKKITARVIREKSSIVISLLTGAEISRYEAASERFARRSQSAKKAAETRKKNRESFECFIEDEYRPKESVVKVYNFVNDVLSPLVPVDYFNELIEIASHPSYRGSAHIRYVRQQNGSLIINKINGIINSNKAMEVYNNIASNNNLTELKEEVGRSVWGSDEVELEVSVTKVLRFLSNGSLTSKDYEDLMNEVDVET